jgi:predicted outer membrane protein
VRSFAQQMADDQSSNYRDLQALCEKKGYAIVPQMDSRQAEIFNKLQSASGSAALDRVYVDAIAADQSGMESLLEKIANNSNDSDITRFASDTLISVKKHEQMAATLVRN